MYWCIGCEFVVQWCYGVRCLKLVGFNCGYCDVWCVGGFWCLRLGLVLRV